MKGRCKRETSSAYKWYGGKGITYCEEWEDYAPFRDWAIKNGYADNLTLDRIDPNKGYTPDNCRWVDWKTQQNNRTNNRIITINGESHTLAEWSNITGINSCTISSRIGNGWSDEKAVTAPLVRPAKKPKVEKPIGNGLSSRNTSGYAGVSKTANNTWRAYIFVNHKQVWLGAYKTKEEAAAARAEAEKTYGAGDNNDKRNVG